jgi:Protein of unknown function (DUF3987)
MQTHRAIPRPCRSMVEVGDFIWPALYVQEATIQRLAKLCEARPRGMMQIRDELSGLFASMVQQSGARSFYLEAWNGERHVVERVATVVDAATNRCLDSNASGNVYTLPSGLFNALY